MAVDIPPPDVRCFIPSVLNNLYRYSSTEFVANFQDAYYRTISDPSQDESRFDH
jgi:hypothetical protein